MSYYPADSDDARELREREDDPAPAHDCDDGWLPQDETTEDQPRPCPVCKPHLVRFRRRLRVQMYGRSR